MADTQPPKSGNTVARKIDFGQTLWEVLMFPLPGHDERGCPPCWWCGSRGPTGTTDPYLCAFDHEALTEGFGG